VLPGAARGQKADILSPMSQVFSSDLLRPIYFLAFLTVVVSTSGQTASEFPCPENQVAHYTAYKTSGRIKIDGLLDEAAWHQAPTSPSFVDILTGKPTLHDTRASRLRDDENLYVAYRVDEPRVHAKFTTNNSPI